MRAAAVTGEADVDEVVSRGARAAGDGRRGARRGRLDEGAVHVRERRARCASRSSTTAASARSCVGSRRTARQSTSSRTTSTPTRSPATTACCSHPAPAIPRRSSTRRRRCASCSAARPCSASASATSCSRSRRAARRSSCRSATAARTTRCSTTARRSVLVTSQNHGFAVAAGDDADVTHTSLYDGTVEGLDYPELRARSAQFHPEASPGPARRRLDHRRLGRRAEGAA